MKKATLRKFKSLYEGMRREIISTLNTNSSCELDIDGDDIDQVQGKALSEVMNALSKRDIGRLSRIESALKKIEDGSFGTCESCGGKIGEKRLEALPGTDLCVQCAETEEFELRSYAASS